MIRWLAVLPLCGCADLIGITETRDLEVVELSVSAGTLTPAFDPAVTRYRVDVGYPDATLDIHAAANDPQATIEIAGMASVEGTATTAVALGDSTVEVKAITESGVERRYEIEIHRADLVIAFAPPRSVPTQVPGMIQRVEVADLDGNGSLDLGVVTGSGEIATLTNNGGAQFAQVNMFAYGFVRDVAVRDLDSDGKPDMVVTAGGQVQIARGTGGGHFEPPQSCGGPPMPGAFAMLQLDSDGRPDLVVADQTGRLLPMAGMPSNCFGSMPALDQNVSPTQLMIVRSGTLDAGVGDDVATVDPMAGRIFVHRNLGGGLSLEQVDVGSPLAKPVELVLADTDGDGRDELVWIDAKTNDVVVQPFPGPRGASYHVEGNPRSLRATDLDGDGKRDIVVLVDGGLMVLHNEGGGTFSMKSLAMTMPGVAQLAIADLNDDGRADLVTCNFTSTLTVHMGEAP